MITLRKPSIFCIEFFLEKPQTLVTYKSDDLLTFLIYDYYLSYQFTCIGNTDLISAIEASDFYDDDEMRYYRSCYGEGLFDASYVFNGQPAKLQPENMLNKMIEDLFYYVSDLSLWPTIFQNLDIFTLDYARYQEVLADDKLRALLAFTTMQELCHKAPIIEETPLHL